MRMFARRGDQRLAAPAAAAGSVASLIQAAGQPSLFAHSEFVKEATCMRPAGVPAPRGQGLVTALCAAGS